MKQFKDVDVMREWVEENPDEVARHFIDAWERILREEKDVEVVFRCTEDEHVDILVQSDRKVRALEALLDEAVEREDYEAAQRIKDLQEEFKLS